MDPVVQVFIADVPTEESTDIRRITKKMLRVKVQGGTRRHLWSHVDLDLGAPGLRRQAGIAAGAIVEQHQQRYKDRTDPSRAAAEAERQFKLLGLPS